MRLLFTALAIACAFAPTAFAQQAATAPANPVVLRVESGSVMVSQQGGEFVTVESDVTLQPQDRVLVTEGAVANLDYGQGCSMGLVTGTAVVAASCPTAGAPTSANASTSAATSSGTGVAAAAGTNTALIVGGVVGVAAVAAAVGGGSSSDTPPVSR